MTPWKPGTPCGRDETFGSSLSSQSLTRRSTEFSRPGRRALSAGNWQPWDFVLVTNKAQLIELAKVWQGAQHVAAAAAAIAIVAPEPQDDRQSALLEYDLGQATYAMTVAAADLGVGTGHAAAADQDQARAVLGFPEKRFLAYVLSVGYPSDKPLAVIERLNRRPFAEVVHRGGW